MWLTEGSISKKIVFSGDVGNKNQPLLKKPTAISEADYVLVESTYGDRLHSAVTVDYVQELSKTLNETFMRGGNVVIPSFAVGRTQEMLYFMRQIKEEGLVKDFPDFQVYVDSPLAVDATSVFQKNSEQCFDEDALALVKKGVNPITFPGLNLAITVEESKQINEDEEPKVIISASGMCEAGRIRHHLKHNLWRPESTILFVGYQAVGTLGRALMEGATSVKLFGEQIEVRAEIRGLVGMSGHADMAGLLEWMRGFSTKPERVFVVHGEDTVTDKFAATLKEELGLEAYAPYSGTVVDLATGQVVHEAEPRRIVETAKARVVSSIFDRLMAAGQRLIAVIRKNEHSSNKDIAKFADQINSLADKWDR